MSKTTNVEHSNQTAVSLSMKRDGRTLDHKTLEAIRLMAVEQVREGARLQSHDDLHMD